MEILNGPLGPKSEGQLFYKDTPISYLKTWEVEISPQQTINMAGDHMLKPMKNRSFESNQQYSTVPVHAVCGRNEAW